MTSLFAGGQRAAGAASAGRMKNEVYDAGGLTSAAERPIRAPSGGFSVKRPNLLVLAAVAVLGATLSSQARPSFTLALAGDSIITRRIAIYTEPAHTRLFDLIRHADASFTNLEMLFHDYEPYPMNESGGTWMRAEPELLKDLVWAGFDLVSRANNHAGDYGVEGMRLTTRHVAEAGLVQAGVGEDLGEAREARFLDTPKGRIALISIASTFPDHSRAGRARDGVRGRPGLNPLRFTTTNVVSRERLQQLRAIQQELTGRAPAEGDTVTFMRQRFVAGDRPGVRTEPRKEDVEEIAAVVRNASRMADYTLVTIHAHEGAPGDRSMPAEFLVAFAHAMIDAGADILAGHGPHVVRGIEIYKGKPIVYSLGDFIFQNETLLRMPADSYDNEGMGADAGVADFNDKRFSNDKSGFPADREIWEGIVAVPKWENRRLSELAIYPVSLGFGKPRTERGRPVLADAVSGRKILDDVASRSVPFGTTVTIREGVGYVDLGRTSNY
jgi:poly-gamma-glutamate capsule biosynthesis protein CapA/YwtB (metallophosphatase superfamily)